MTRPTWKSYKELRLSAYLAQREQIRARYDFLEAKVKRFEARPCKGYSSMDTVGEALSTLGLDEPTVLDRAEWTGYSETTIRNYLDDTEELEKLWPLCD